jgi:hypothetical protein
MTDETFYARLMRIVDDISLPENFKVLVGCTELNMYYFQIECWRMDVITKEEGPGYGGKAFLDPDATDSQLVGTTFGLYKGYVEHEARETFQYKGRRVFGPHIDVDALWDVARRVDVRDAQHVGDLPRPERPGWQPAPDHTQHNLNVSRSVGYMPPGAH